MNSPDFEPKLIYLTRRHPDLTRPAFRARWRQHAALGMSRPRWKNIAQYMHCDVVDDSDFDGIGLIWHRSPIHRAAHLADTSSRLAMERDEAETFARPIVTDCLLAREHVLTPPSTLPGTALRLFRFIADAPAATADPIDAAAGRARRLVERGITTRGHLLDLALPPERPPRWGLGYALIEEWRCDDLGAARLAAATLETPGVPCVITNEVPLYEAR
ncbi:MAG: hypothetical protein R3E65_01565 [Steroidobacteraceae bacterium]